jgi:hypothetical protein
LVLVVQVIPQDSLSIMAHAVLTPFFLIFTLSAVQQGRHRVGVILSAVPLATLALTFPAKGQRVQERRAVARQAQVELVLLIQLLGPQLLVQQERTHLLVALVLQTQAMVVRVVLQVSMAVQAL